jgi:uncharacterized damage-inducible protein DinB
MEVLVFFEFNVKVRKALLSTLGKLPMEELTADRGISFGSIRDTIFHTIRVEDFWVNVFLREAERMVDKEDLERITGAGDLQALWDRVGATTRDYLRGLSPEDLAEQREVSVGSHSVTKSVEEYAFTFLIHEVYYKGEVLAALWQMGMEPPPVDYWGY